MIIGRCRIANSTRSEGMWIACSSSHLMVCCHCRVRLSPTKKVVTGSPPPFVFGLATCARSCFLREAPCRAPDRTPTPTDRTHSECRCCSIAHFPKLTRASVGASFAWSCHWECPSTRGNRGSSPVAPCPGTASGHRSDRRVQDPATQAGKVDSWAMRIERTNPYVCPTNSFRSAVAVRRVGPLPLRN
jgi:hypothetical protein